MLPRRTPAARSSPELSAPGPRVKVAIQAQEDAPVERAVARLGRARRPRGGSPAALAPACLVALLALAAPSPAGAGPGRPRGPLPHFEVQSLWQNLGHPAAIVFESERRLFYIERLGGRVRLIDRGVLQPDPVAVLEVAGAGEQGLLGLALHPDFAANRLLFVYGTAPGPLRNRVVRLREREGQAEDARVILDGLPAASFHNGGGLRFGPDGKLYVGVGDAGDPAAAQDRGVPSGKVLRMNPNGSVPGNNPIPGSLVYALGIGSAAGLAFHPLTGRLFATDSGPGRSGGLNVVRPGGNYGWPRAVGPARDGRFLDPAFTLRGPVGFTSLAFYTGLRYPPALRFNLFLGEYDTGLIRRLVLRYPDYTQVERDEVFIQAPGPVLDVADAPDGHLYFATPSGIYRVLYVGR